MKISYLKIIALFMFIGFGAFAQKTPPNAARVILDTKGVGEYHTIKELEILQKGVLTDLYVERVKIITNVFPYIGLTTKPGVTLKDVGIEETEEIVKKFDDEKLSKVNYLSGNSAYMKKMLQYADKGDIIKAIVFFEDVLKKLSKGGVEE